MRVPAHIERNLFAPDERSLQRLVDDSTLTEVARDWGVETAAECGCAGLRPIWRLGEESLTERRRPLRLGMLWFWRRPKKANRLLSVFTLVRPSGNGDLSMRRYGGA